MPPALLLEFCLRLREAWEFHWEFGQVLVPTVCLPPVHSFVADGCRVAAAYLLTAPSTTLNPENMRTRKNLSTEAEPHKQRMPQPIHKLLHLVAVPRAILCNTPNHQLSRTGLWGVMIIVSRENMVYCERLVR